MSRTPEAPAGAGEAARSAGRRLIFPATPGAPGLPVEVGTERTGDWYPSPDLPASPVASLVAGTAPEDAPPLTALRDAGAGAGFWSPLDVRLGRRGPPRPSILAGQADGRRVAVALGEGYWRWALAGGAGRVLYDRVWSAVAGWLAEEEGGASQPVRPVRRTVALGSPVRWVGPIGADSARVTLTPADDGGARGIDTTVAGSVRTPVDTVIRLPGDTIGLAGLPPGHYRYRVEVHGGGDGSVGVVEGEGDITVESYTAELTRPAATTDIGSTGNAAGDAVVTGRGRRPLHTTPWPYAVLVAVLCVEWVLRRRWGLR